MNPDLILTLIRAALPQALKLAGITHPSAEFTVLLGVKLAPHLSALAADLRDGDLHLSADNRNILAALVLDVKKEVAA